MTFHSCRNDPIETKDSIENRVLDQFGRTRLHVQAAQRRLLTLIPEIMPFAHYGSSSLPLMLLTYPQGVRSRTIRATARDRSRGLVTIRIS